MSAMPIYAYAADCPPSNNELCNYSLGTFYHLDNVIGVNLYGVQNNATFSQNNLGTSNSNATAPGVEGFWDIQTGLGFYWSNHITYQNFLGTNGYTSDQASYNLKLGWSFQPVYDYWQITPYLAGSAGAGMLNWDSTFNYGAGAGLRTEVALGTRNSLYADYNYQLLIDGGGNFTTAYNQQFTGANAVATNGTSGNPTQQAFEFGYKHVFNCLFSMQAYYRVIQSNIDYSIATTPNSNNNYSNLNQMVGVGVSWYTGM